MTGPDRNEKDGILGRPGAAKMMHRRILDIAMIILLPVLMSYSLAGETLHEAVGLVMFALFIAHHVLNRRWWKALPRGKYPPGRIFRTAIVLFLTVFMFAQPVSGILMSKNLFTAVTIPGAAAGARTVHLFLAYWGFVLLCVHAGTHLTRLFAPKPAGKRRIGLVILIAVSVYGAAAFVRRGIPAYLFLHTRFVFFDFAEPRPLFYLDYAAVMVLFITVGAAAAAALDRKRKTGKETT